MRRNMISEDSRLCEVWMNRKSGEKGGQKEKQRN